MCEQQVGTWLWRVSGHVCWLLRSLVALVPLFVVCVCACGVLKTPLGPGFGSRSSLWDRLVGRIDRVGDILVDGIEW